MVQFAAEQPASGESPGRAVPSPRRSTAELEQLGDEIAELAAHIHAAVYRLLVQLREFDRREGWSGGFVSCAHWLSWRTGIDLGAAREKVRVARALESLPLISDGLRRGALSYSKVRAVTRIATPATDCSLHDFALQSTTAQLERLVRAWRTVDRQEEARAERERHATRYLTLTPDGDGMFELRGRLDPEVAMALKRALEAASWALYKDDQTRRDTPAEARRADAIGLLAECALKGERLESDDAAATVSHSDHRLVVIHTDMGTLQAQAEAPRSDAEGWRSAAGAGDAVLEDGTRVSAETSRRLACDAARVIMTHAPDGSVLDVGRKTRTAPPALRRALDQRDGGCRFPGCGSRFCDAHHVRHWADGGATRLDNLVLLCRVHHRAVHEDGFSVEMNGGQPWFSRPDGRPLPEVPPAPVLGENPTDALRAAHAEARLEITTVTTLPFSQPGDRFDLKWAVAALWQPRDSCLGGA